MMLKLQDRQKQKFLLKNSHPNEGIVSCCPFFHSAQDKTTINQQKSNTQQKISLKKVNLQSHKHAATVKNTLPASKITRNVNNKEPTRHSPQANLPIPPQKIITFNKPNLNNFQSQTPSLMLSCKSQQNLHALTHSTYNNIHFKAVTFQFANSHSRNTEQLISTVQSMTHFEVASIKQVEKIDQTTCMEHQSQLSLSHNFARSLTSTKLLIPSQQKMIQNQQQAPIQEQDQWSGQSLSSQTNLRFDQIDQEQSISDSTSMHHRNIVIVNHGSHPQLFEEFRKAHTIRSNLSRDDENFSGHSIVLDREHPFVVTPLKKHERSENRHYGSGDF